MSSAPLIPGYDLAEPLGTGATATVWRARRHADGLPVAVKVITPRDGRVGEALEEAGVLARMRHQHVVHLFDVLPVQGQDGQDPAVALVTQLAGGGSLAQVLARRRLLSPGELVTVLQPAAGALADLHQQGVVHGDLSTGNIVFLEDGMPLLADLGTARIAGEELLRGVGTGAGDGMVAPEVVEGFPATRESDVYQLGALARLCLVGEVPGPGFDRPALADVAPALPDLLVDLVERCMAPQPEDRPDAEELAVALNAVGPPEPIEVAPDADAAHGLTQRLRQVGQADEAARAEREQPGAHRPERVPGGTSTDPARTQARGVAAVGVGVIVLALLFGVLWPAARSLLAPGPSVAGEARVVAPTGAIPPPDAATTQAPAADLAAGSPTAATPTALPDGSSLTNPPARGSTTGSAPDAAEVKRILQDLVDARARAWEAGDEDLLGQALAAQSPAWEHESRQLERAREQEVSYPAVGFTVQDAVVVEQDTGRMIVTAEVHREPLEAVRPTGWLLRTPARTDQVSVELVQVEGRWWLWSWTGPPG